MYRYLAFSAKPVAFRKWVAFSLLFIVFAACSDDNPTGALETEATITETMDAYLDRTQPADEPGVSILIRKNGQTTYQHSKGLAKKGGNVPITSRTGFRIGSITKTFTALAIMRLVEQGEVTLDDKLLDHIPSLPASFKDITIAQLLTHESGLLDYLNDNNNRQTLNNITNDRILELLPTTGIQNLEFAPGSRAEYSNTGFVMLAMIIEQVAGKSYPVFMQEQFFDRLGMSDSYIIHADRRMSNSGKAFAMAYGTTTQVFNFNALIYGASNQVSSLEDLNVFVEALLNGDVVRLETLQQMTQTRSRIPEFFDYGYGWQTGTGQHWHTGIYTSPNDFWHLGGFDGYRAIISFNPDLDLQVVVLTNNGERSQEQMLDILELARRFYADA